MKLTKEQEQIYASPTIEVVEIAIEQGFLMSGTAPDSDDSEFGSYAYN